MLKLTDLADELLIDAIANVNHEDIENVTFAYKQRAGSASNP